MFPAGDTAPVAAIGGVFRSSILLETFRSLVELDKGCQLRRPAYPPAVGALIEAYRAEGLRPEIHGAPRAEK